MKADQNTVTRLVKTARGQLDGVLRMMEEDAYCVDVLNQILAAQAVLKRAQKEILEAHMRCCVSQAFSSGDESAREEKIQELSQLFEKMNR